MTGYLDSVSSRRITGWAVEDSGEPAKLLARVNGDAVARFKCSLIRSDLTSHARKDLGFDVDFGRVLSPGDFISVTNDRDEHLSGSPHTFKASDLSRQDKALRLIAKQMKILEIGPSLSPIAPKSQQWQSFSLDHCTQEELKAKYRGQQPVENIEPVDYVWKDGPIESAIPKSEHGSFDAIIASHVLEHIPDPIGFFESAALLLKPQGLVSLIMPDKRWMFDFFKPLTVTSDWMMAHHERRARHTKKSLFDWTALNVSENHAIAWSLRPMREFNFIENDMLAIAKHKFDETPQDGSGPYVDVHATICTPSSLALIFLELRYLGLMPFEQACSFPVSGCEFYVTLRRAAPAKYDPQEIRAERLRLLKTVIRELSEQARWLVDDE